MDEIKPFPRKKINVSLLLGISAVFLSASALIVSIIQTTILRDQKYATVWPYIQATAMNTNVGYSYGIENTYKGRVMRVPKRCIQLYSVKITPEQGSR